MTIKTVWKLPRPEVDRREPCERCGGTGKVRRPHSREMDPCSGCGGSGKVEPPTVVEV